VSANDLRLLRSHMSALQSARATNSACYRAKTDPSLPLVPLAVLIIGRDILLGISALYYRYISLPHPKSFARYWDFSLPSAEVRPTTISKINTFLQLGLIGATMGGMAVGGFEGMVVGGIELQRVLEGAWWVVGGTTVWSGLSYIWGGRGVKILGRK